PLRLFPAPAGGEYFTLAGPWGCDPQNCMEGRKGQKLGVRRGGEASGSALTFESQRGFPRGLVTCESGGCEREFRSLSSPLTAAAWLRSRGIVMRFFRGVVDLRATINRFVAQT